MFTQSQANSYLLQLEAAHYGTSMSECLSIFRPELCRALDTKVRTQSAFINRHHLLGTWHIERFNYCQSYKVC